MVGATTSAAGSAMWGQLQQQQAQRNAEQAEQRANALRDEALRARSEADAAQDKARTLGQQSEQARQEATDARRDLASFNSLEQTGSRLEQLSGQVLEVIDNLASGVYSAPSPGGGASLATPAPTGSLIDVTA